MNIAYISTFLPQRCGIATYTDYLTNALLSVDKKIKIKIVAEKSASPFDKGRIKCLACWSREEDYVKPILSNCTDVDVVHVQHEYSIYKQDQRLPSLLKLLGKAKKVITIHCVRPRQFSDVEKVEDFTKEIAELADDVIVHLKCAKDILSRLGVDESKINVIPHGSELNDLDKIYSRKKLGLPEKGKIILLFGFVKKHKNAHIAIEALKEIEKEISDVYLFIAGGLAPNAPKRDVNYSRFIRRKIKKLGLEEKVIFPNKFFPNEDVPYIFSSCDVVFFPYYEEDRSSSGSLHLSIGAKKPAVAFRIPKFEELKEICDELLVLPYNTLGIAKVATRLFTDQDFEKYVMKRLEKYRKKTCWEEVAKKHLKVYV
jgi:glycosyltransferase involved in cell wall biosynthesis